MKEKLNLIRNSIDIIDNKILALLEERMGLVEKVADLKDQNLTASYIKADREAAMMKQLMKKINKVPYQVVWQIWRIIISMSLQQEKPFKVFVKNDYLHKDQNLRKSLVEYFGVITEIEAYGDFQSGNYTSNSANILLLHQDDIREYNFLCQDYGYKIFAKLPIIETSKEQCKYSDYYIIAQITPESLSEDVFVILSNINEEELEPYRGAVFALEGIETYLYELPKEVFFKKRNSFETAENYVLLGSYANIL